MRNVEEERLIMTSNKSKIWISRGFIISVIILFLLSTICLYLWLSWYVFGNSLLLRIIRRTDNDNWDFIVFSQEYPIGYCIVWSETKQKRCNFGSDKYAWSVHGIWPSKIGTEGPAYCRNVSFNTTELEPIIKELNDHWSSVGDNNYIFWEHEWKKHGSCVGENSKFNTEVKYFEEGLDLNKQYDIRKMLQISDINPTDSKTYTLSEIRDSIKNYTNSTPSVSCTKDKERNVYIVTEIYLCFSKELKLVNCDECRLMDQCPIDGIYYPKTDAFKLP